ncbi:DUF3298 and DUF4163 domain-containing protein [Robertkochia aurantiaca]|uniref:DUF3298 and DUF4163 domain-containing protein n=1 Tax=Robertkochia aurantiaca TaxID=2873700 RepID=UPI001CCAD3F5|nr:DUF3298 and DUF4163 domain-containing protein [Robertkochia sp. 3YJGBD-33]
MKLKYYLPVLSLLFLACNTEKNISFNEYLLEDPACESCARVSLKFPKTDGGSRKERKIDHNVTEWVTSILAATSSKEPGSVEQAAETFRKSYERVKGDFPEYQHSWEGQIEGSVCYQNSDILAICMNTYFYTGGAHGISNTYYLFFDKATGDRMKAEQLFKDHKEFEKLAEQKFRAHYKIAPDAPLNKSGFMFNNDRFHLPETIGINGNGLKLIYNPYEVAPYSEGQIVIDIPFAETGDLLNIERKS